MSGRDADDLHETDPEMSEELQGLAERLDSAALQERESIREASRRSSSAADEELIAETLFAAAGVERPAARFRPWKTLSLAAALILALFWIWRGSDDGGGQMMGSGDLELVQPEGIESFELFRWKAELPDGGRYELRIYDATAAATAKPVVEERSIKEEQWRPSAKQLEALPDRIRWEIRVLDRSGGIDEAGSAEASRPGS